MAPPITERTLARLMLEEEGVPPPEPAPPPRRSAGATGTAATLVAMALIGFLDYLTGPEIGLSLFYLVPVAACAWWLGRRAALVAATAAAVVWIAADLAVLGRAHVAISLWNGVSRLAIFALVGALVARRRRDGEKLGELNVQFRALLAREQRLARTDALTGLANSRAFLETLRTEAARSRREAHTLCVAYVDLDNFKRVNDRFGHTAGDELLRNIATALRETVRATDVTARLGGDEFAMILWEVEPGTAEAIAHRLVERVASFAADYAGCALGATVGLACYARAPDDVDEIVRRADEAMYEAKARGKGQVVVWREDGFPTASAG